MFMCLRNLFSIMSNKFGTIFIIIPTILLKCCFAVEVTFEQGTLRGSSYLSRNGTEYYGFLSIPFAKPPIGELRFEPPQPPDSWKGIRNATQPSPKCIQKENYAIRYLGVMSGQEDCLYLNVYTPVDKTRPVPVMVFMHGGAFIVGSCTPHNPKYFMDYKIIIVCIHYRLSILGFLSTGDHVLPGNLGMKDQVAALKWVQKNIAAFGGDPNKVTIFGESSGGASVHYHLHSPLSKGLFHRGISQSGTALAPWAHTPRILARQRAQALGVLTCCPTKSSRALVDCLKKIPAEELIAACTKFYAWNYNPSITFSIVMEPEDVEGAFITENPWHHEVVNNVPWIVGINSGEGGMKVSRYLYDGGSINTINQYYERLLPINLFYGSWIEDESKISNITEQLKRFYFGDKDISNETIHELVRLHSDGLFIYDGLEAAQRHKGIVYFYYYDHRNERTFNEMFGTFHEDLGVSHCDNLISLFYLGLFPEVTKGNDFEVSERIIKYWVNFAYNGNPNDEDEKWTPIVSDDIEYLHITTKADQMKKDLLKERFQFWKSLQVVPTFTAKNSPKLADEL